MKIILVILVIVAGVTVWYLVNKKAKASVPPVVLPKSPVSPQTIGQKLNQEAQKGRNP